MANITFDGTVIQTSTYSPRYIQHETSPDRNLFTFPIARDDGQVFVAELYGKKIIRVTGMLHGTSSADLDSKIDTFKELFSRVEKNLDISWNNDTRRYVATCSRHEFTRDFYNISAVPWYAEFTVSLGVGVDTSITTGLAQHTITTVSGAISNFDYIYDDSVTFAGSQSPKPGIILEVVTATSAMKGIELTNLDTNERLLVTRNVDWSTLAGKQILINVSGMRVTDNFSTTNQAEGSFVGIMPRFKIGTNNFRIRTGGFLNQTSTETTLSAADYRSFTDAGTTLEAQSFQVPYSDSTFSTIQIAAAKTGSPTGNLVFVIKSDDGTGQPNWGGATLATFTIDKTQMVAYPTFTYIRCTTTAFSLSANTTYWLVAEASGSVDASNYFRIAVSQVNDSNWTYVNGSTMLSTNAGSTWSAEGSGVTMAFKIYVGGDAATTSLKSTVNYIKKWL